MHKFADDLAKQFFVILSSGGSDNFENLIQTADLGCQSRYAFLKTWPS